MGLEQHFFPIRRRTNKTKTKTTPALTPSIPRRQWTPLVADASLKNMFMSSASFSSPPTPVSPSACTTAAASSPSSSKSKRGLYQAFLLDHLQQIRPGNCFRDDNSYSTVWVALISVKNAAPMGAPQPRNQPLVFSLRCAFCLGNKIKTNENTREEKKKKTEAKIVHLRDTKTRKAKSSVRTHQTPIIRVRTDCSTCEL